MPLAAAVDQILEILLLSGDRLWLQAFPLHFSRQVFQRALAFEDRLAFRAVPASVAAFDMVGELAVLDHLGRHQQAAGADVHAADMGVEQVVGIEGLAADLGIEVQAAGGEAAAFQDVIKRKADLRNVVRELIGIPARLRIAAVDVDRAEDAECHGKRDFMLEGMAGERRVVGLDIDLDLVFQAVGL